MSLARHPSLRYDGPASNPGVSVGTMIVEMPCGPPAGSVAAATMLNVEIAEPEFVMKAFEPSTIHSPPSNRPVVCTSAASEPAPGSVSPNPPNASPRASGASHRSFCSSVPNRFSRFPARPSAADSVMATDWSTRPSSSSARHTVIASASDPPTAAGNGSPNSPRSPICLMTSSGSFSSRSASAVRGATTSFANSRTTPRNAACSEVRSKFMPT